MVGPEAFGIVTFCVSYCLMIINTYILCFSKMSYFAMWLQVYSSAFSQIVEPVDFEKIKIWDNYDAGQIPSNYLKEIYVIIR